MFEHLLDRLPDIRLDSAIMEFILDLIAANRQQLLACGVPGDHIVDSTSTTCDDAFFSDRAQRPCGRFALLARLLSGVSGMASRVRRR